MLKQKRIMSLPLQIKRIRMILRKANPDLEEIDFERENGVPDPENDYEYCDWTTCLQEVSQPENINLLKERFPNINWQLPKERKRRKGPRRALLMYESPDGTGLCASAVVVVKSLKTLDKKARVVKALGHLFEYEFGRIQITVPKELIGRKANVHIEFPNVPPLAVERSLARVSRGNRKKRPWRRPRKQFDHVQTEGGHFSKKEPKNKTQP